MSKIHLHAVERDLLTSEAVINFCTNLRKLSFMFFSETQIKKDTFGISLESSQF